MIAYRQFSLTAVIGASALLIASHAAAHASLVSSTPVANATGPAPKVITLTFSEKVVPAFSGFDVAMVDHKMKVAVKTRVAKDGKTIMGSPKGKLMPGAYRITWRVASPDGHRMTGTVDFKVG